jgi:ribonuclease PH
MEFSASVCHGPPMPSSTTKAGGFFLTVLITGGFIAGVLAGNPMAGVLIGTAVGIALALLLWLIDRRRAG